MKLLSLILAIVSLACTSIYSDSKENLKKTKSVRVAKKEFSFYEDGLERKILLEDSLLAEFGGTSNGKSFAKTSVPVQDARGVKIWNIADSTLSKSLSKGDTSSLSGNLSPVFSENGRLMALPGGVVLQLKPGINVSTWASSKGIKTIEKMGIPNFYTISTATGLDSLNLANSLKNDPSVVSSTPNFWMESEQK
ncbi:MAG: hypothetical protein SFU98_01980 [Leptospiraceae bacterium]|nr:hypothetical protein [Leptospiraceae bacterium]